VACTQTISDQYDILAESMMFLVAAHNQFQDSNFPKSYLLPIRDYSWQKDEIKRIRRGCYGGNNFQDSTKEKLQK
jgi:hypothetical protein